MPLPSVAFVFLRVRREIQGSLEENKALEIILKGGGAQRCETLKPSSPDGSPRGVFIKRSPFSTTYIQTMKPSGVDSSALCSTGTGDNEALNHLMTKAKRHHPIKQCAPPLIWATAREPFLGRRTIKSASEPASGNPGPFTFHLGACCLAAIVEAGSRC